MKIIVEWEGIDAMLRRFTEIGEKGAKGVEQQMGKLGKDALEVMRGATHVRSGRLLEGDKLEIGGYSFRLYNEVFYAPFVERGHRMGGWAARHGHEGFVEARPFLKPAVEFGIENILDYLSHSLDEV